MLYIFVSWPSYDKRFVKCVRVPHHSGTYWCERQVLTILSVGFDGEDGFAADHLATSSAMASTPPTLPAP